MHSARQEQNNISARKNKEFKDFLLHPDMPKDLKLMVLDQFSLLELAILVLELKKGLVDKNSKKLILNKFNQRRQQDFQAVIHAFKEEEKELSKKKGYLPAFATDQAFLKWKAIFLISIEQTHDSLFAERVFVHLWHLDPKKAEKSFNTYICSTPTPNQKLVAFMLSYGQPSQINLSIRKFAAEYDVDDGYDIFTRSAYLKKWTYLAEVVMTDNPSLIHFATNQYPKQARDTMSALNELQKTNAKYGSKCFYSLDRIQEAKIKFLLHLETKHKPYYSFTHADKRLIESYLLKEINNLKSRKELFEFYRQHADSFYLTYRRHSFYDTLFSNKPFTRGKSNVLMALQKKLMLLGNSEENETTDAKKEALDEKRSFLKNILFTKQNELMKQTQCALFSLFYSGERTQNKLRMIDSSLKQLENIASLDELKLFTENLMLNSDIIARRSLGLSASDTFKKVNEYYGTHFNINLC